MQPGRVAFGRIALSGALLAPMLGSGASSAFAATASGTVISNTASASYTDGNGNTYSTNSNTVSTTVQNAPQLAVTGTPGTAYAPGAVATDTYTFTNNGNSAGTFNVSTFTNTTNDTPAAPGIASYTVVYNGVTTVYTSLAALNTGLGADSVNPNASLTVAVTYTVPATAGTTAGANTYSTTPTATITQPAAGTAPAVTSTSATATVNDTVSPDARLDLQKSAATAAAAGTTPALIDYTINANNGGNFGTKDLKSAEAVVGAAVPGILISDEIPQFGGSPLAFNGPVTFTTSAANGYSATTAQLYYSTSPTGAAPWTALAQGGTIPTGTKVYFLGLFLANTNTTGTTASLGSHPGTTDGNVPNASAAVQLTFALVQPTGAGSANAPYLNGVNGAIGSNQATETILAPGVPTGTADSASAAPLESTTGTGSGIDNTKFTGGTNGNVDEASNQTSTSLALAPSALIGPNGAPGAVGNYTGTGTADTNNDFSTGVLTVGATGNTSTNSGTVAGTPNGSAAGAATTAVVTNTIQNTGNATDTYTLTFGTLPAGITVGSVVVGGTTITPNGAGAYVLPALASNASQNVVITYKGATTVKTLTQLDVPITITGANATTANPDTNMTHNELYDGFIALTKSATVTNSGCPTGVTATTICPGGTIQYIVDYRNIVPALVAGSTGDNTSSTTASALKVTEDGTAAPNNWAANTGGLTAAPVDSANAATTTYQYFVNGTGGATTTTAAGAQAFIATVGALAPGAHSTITFNVVLK